MAKRHEFSVRRSFSGDARALLEREADAAQWNRWAPAPTNTFSWESEPPADLGEGATRRLSLGPLALVERTTGYEPGEYHSYTMDPLLTMRDYTATLRITRTDADGGEFEWTSSLTTTDPVSGVVFPFAMKRVIIQIANKLVASAAKELDG